MKRYTIPLTALPGVMSASGPAMAHGGHDATASTALHTLYHLVVVNRLPMLLVVGMLVVLVLGRTSVVDTVRRIIERK